MATRKQTHCWTADQWTFIRWLARPSAKREPKTQRELAARLQLDTGTLTRWKRLPGFMDAVTGDTRVRPGGDVRDLYDALMKQAVDGNVTAIKLALELTGEYPPRPETDAPVTVLITKMRMDDL